MDLNIGRIYSNYLYASALQIISAIDSTKSSFLQIGIHLVECRTYTPLSVSINFTKMKETEKT